MGVAVHETRRLAAFRLETPWPPHSSRFPVDTPPWLRYAVVTTLFAFSLEFPGVLCQTI